MRPCTAGPLAVREHTARSPGHLLHTQAPDADARWAGGRATDQPAPGAVQSTPATPKIALGSKRPNSSMQTRVRFWGKSGKQNRRRSGGHSTLQRGQKDWSGTKPAQSAEPETRQPAHPSRTRSCETHTKCSKCPTRGTHGKNSSCFPHDLGHTAGYVRLTTNRNRVTGAKAGPDLASDTYYFTASLPGTISY